MLDCNGHDLVSSGGDKMKWKDSSEMAGQEDVKDEEYFDEEQFSPWTSDKSTTKASHFSKFPKIFILLGLAIVSSLAALLILLLGSRGSVDHQQIQVLEERILRLEDRLDKFEAIDEKVTRIWEQAKSYEKFKDRYERSEASTSLRMDHLTMSLESLQKQLSEANQAKAAPPSNATASTPSVNTKPESKPVESKVQSIQYHKVTPGDTYYSISRRYGLSVKDLLKMNHLTKDDVLQVGQKLIVRQNQVD